AENDKIKQHYKELYDSIKITRAKHIEQVTALTTKNVNLKAQILEKVDSVSKDQVKPKVFVRGKHAIDVEPIIPRLRNNRDAHLDYLRLLKESVETIRDIVEEAKVVAFVYRHSLTIHYFNPPIENSTLCVKKYHVSDLSFCAGSELGSELISLVDSELGSKLSSLAGSELGSKLSSLAGSELSLASYRPPMLDRTDFASWQQRIRLYCRGKENEELKGPYILGQNDLESILALHLKRRIDIWDNVKMLLEGSELTKEDCKSQLYDDFEHFQQHKGETIHDYYVWFAKLINDMRNIKMTMSRMQLNSKTLSPMDNLIENLTNILALLTQSYKTYLPQINNQLRTLSNPRNQTTIQDDRVVVQTAQGRQNRGQENNARGAGVAGYMGAQNRVGYANPGQASSKYFKDKMLLMQAQENGVALDEEQLLFIIGGQDNAVDEDVDEQPIKDLALNVDNVFLVDDCDAFDSDVDEAPTVQTLFMANLSSADPVYDESGPSYDLDVLSSNMASYDQYVKDNAVQVVQSDVSAVHNDVYMMILNDMHEPPANMSMSQHRPRKCDEIERKNLLIANDTLIANFLSKKVFYIATNSELNVSRLSEMYDSHTMVQACCLELKAERSKLKDKIQKDDHDIMETRSDADRTLDFRYLDFQITQLTEKVSVLQEQNKLFEVENAKVKQHYKELYDSIKITHSVTPKVLAPGMYAIDVEPIHHRLRNNREVHLDYLKHLKESVATLYEIVKEAKVERPLDRSVASAWLYTKHSQELLEYVIGTCPKDFNKRDKKQATTPLNRKKEVTFADQCATSNTHTQKHVEQHITQKTNV
nr:hypothetical protein [Tanacetum cinerariifolium]